MLTSGSAAPAIALPDQHGDQVLLSSFLGQRVLIFFYPKASTPGCTQQACGLRDVAAQVEGTVILGISPEAANPFLNLDGSPFFWSTAGAQDEDLAWYFSFGHGGQALIDMGRLDKRVWVVRDGDIGEVPVPAAGWLLGAALGVVGARMVWSWN